MKLVISIDVEEEGLFRGHYPRTPPGVSNVAELERLKFIPRDFGFPLTLLVTYPVARDPAACQVLTHWRERYGAEIGVHLHPWNTPPFLDLSAPEPIPSEKLPRSLLQDKLGKLVGEIRSALEPAPRSFRMGRFDAGRQVWSLLPEFCIEIDSSIVPLTPKKNDSCQFLASADPYMLQVPGLKDKELLEVPVTMVPVLAGTPGLLARLSAGLPLSWSQRLRHSFRYVAAVGVQPAWYPLASMQLAAQLHRRRGGRVLTMFFHSSELKPGASRLFPNEAAVGKFVKKIHIFLTWLIETGPVQGVRLADLRQDRDNPKMSQSL